MRAGLLATEKLWPPIRQASTWLHQAAHLLTNAEQREVTTLKQEYQQLLETMKEHQDRLGALAPAVAHFRKVTASYWDGLFHCYQVTDLPRTNNDLEQFFGTARHVERRVDFPQASVAHPGCARLGARGGSGSQSTLFFLGR